jgi:hypothetical protein
LGFIRRKRRREFKEELKSKTSKGAIIPLQKAAALMSRFSGSWHRMRKTSAAKGKNKK